MEKHWVWLTTRVGIGNRYCAALLELFGTAERIYELTEKDYRNTEGFDLRWLEPLMDKSLDGAEEILRNCDDHGISLLTIDREEYPERLKNIADPPAVLYYMGTLPSFDEEVAIGVVGSRKCSAYGLLHAKQFARLIANSGGVVISGGARGIDTMALRGALDSQTPVVCIMGCGLDINYPRENRRLFEDIRHHGCLISEYPPGTPANRAHFPVRNRLISGLSVGVLVVEAPEKSGALITAYCALEQGRDVYAVPGNVGVKQCEGSNRLISEGAVLAENGWEVIKSYGAKFPSKLTDGRRAEAIEKVYRTRFDHAMAVYTPIVFEQQADKKDVDNPPVKIYSDEKGAQLSLGEDEQHILSHLTNELCHLDELIARSKLPTNRVNTALTMLLIKQLAEKTGGNFYRRKSQS